MTTTKWKIVPWFIHNIVCMILCLLLKRLLSWELAVEQAKLRMEWLLNNISWTNLTVAIYRGIQNWMSPLHLVTYIMDIVIPNALSFSILKKRQVISVDTYTHKEFYGSAVMSTLTVTSIVYICSCCDRTDQLICIGSR